MLNFETIEMLSRIKKPRDVLDVIEKNPLCQPMYGEENVTTVFLLNAKDSIERLMMILRTYYPNANIVKKPYEVFLIVERDPNVRSPLMFIVDNLKEPYPNIVIYILPYLALINSRSIPAIYLKRIVPHHFAVHYVTFYSQVHELIMEIVAQIYAMHQHIDFVPQSIADLLREHVSIRQFPWKNTPDYIAIKQLMHIGISPEYAVAYYEGTISNFLPGKKGFHLMDEGEALFLALKKEKKLYKDLAKFLQGDLSSAFYDLLEVYRYLEKYSERFEHYKLDYELNKPLEVITNKKEE
ncbi:MAG: hypothetical protein ACP6IU_10465 [Candidatus Asgardarchaeia archaeon]